MADKNESPSAIGADTQQRKSASKISSGIFEVVHLAGKGEGMIARKKLFPGDVVISEKPVVVVPQATFEDVEACEEFLEKKVNRMSCEDRERMFSLTDKAVFEDGEKSSTPYCGLFYTNAMTWGTDAALCPGLARANHSCRANCEFVARKDLGRIQLVASYVILPGEEITINYMAGGEEALESREVRQSYLRRLYSFQCTCRVCTLQGSELEENEAIRESVMELKAAGTENLDVAELKTLISSLYLLYSKPSYILEQYQQLYLLLTPGSFCRLQAAVQGFTLAVCLYGSGAAECETWRTRLDMQKSIRLMIQHNKFLV